MTYRIYTFGCQMNEHDSERLAFELEKFGYTKAGNGIPDLFIINTCAVRDKAVQKLYTMLGRVREWARRGTIIGVVGCVAQVEKERLIKRFPYISFVLGPRSYPYLLEALSRAKKGGKLVKADWGKNWWETGGARRENPAVAYINIMEGCNNFCTYCIVPFTRGRELYRPLSFILDEVKRVVDQGYKEIQLLGQNVDSWKCDNYKFWHLLDRVRNIRGIKWIRFITSHPKEFSKEIIDIMAEGEPVSPYVHLPIQAGSNKILAAMRRGYTREKFLEIAIEIRKRVPTSSIGTDVIVGFPGEEEKDFMQTLEIMKAVRFDNLYSFHYNPRPFTYAGRFLKDNVPKEVKRKRLIELQELQKEIQLEKNRNFVGKTVEVLVTGRSAKDKRAFMGRDATFRVVNFEYEGENPIGKILEVKIKEAGPHSLKGEVIGE